MPYDSPTPLVGEGVHIFLEACGISGRRGVARSTGINKRFLLRKGARPESETLNPAAYSRNPEPHTPHPNPSNRNPKPESTIL